MSEPRVSERTRRKVIERAQGCCEYCRSQARFSPDPFSIEHIIPRSKGGQDDLENLALACQGCNNRKYVDTDAIDPVTGDLVPLFHPRLDEWSEHFAWHESLTLIVGLTSIGRASVEKLQLNRSGVVNLRHLLHEIGEHPPH